MEPAASGAGSETAAAEPSASAGAASGATGAGAAAGSAGMAAIRVVAPDAPDAWCGDGEMLVSAICVGGAQSAPLTTYTDGAKCGYGDSAARARIMCMPRGAAAPAADGERQGAIGGAATQAADAGSAPVLRVVANGENTASCEPGETLASAYCTGAWSDYPLLTYPGGKVKCGYGGDAQATAVCLPKPAEASDGAAGAGGLRVIASETNVAWCESGETMLGAYCTGVAGSALQTYANGAKCGYSDGPGKATILCSAEVTSAVSGAGSLRVASGSNKAACESDEVMVSAYCTGGWDKYPLLTYGNSAKCGYSNGSSQATAVCMKR